MTENYSLSYSGTSRRKVLGSLAVTGIAGCLGLVDDSVEKPTFMDGDAPWEPEIGEISANNWPMARRDGHNSGFAPEPAGPEPPVELQWSTRLGRDGSIQTPVVADGQVFVATRRDGVLLALEAETGEQIWKEHFGQWLSELAVANETVYVKDAFFQTEDVQPNLISGHDAVTGEQKWAYKLDDDEDQGITLVASSGVLYAAAEESLLALDASTGKLAWRFHPGEPHRRLSSVALGPETVYASAHTTRLARRENLAGTVFALDPATETIEWSVELRQAGDIALAGDTLVVRDLTDLYGFDSETGEQQWRTELRPHSWERRGSVPLFAITDETVYYQAESAETEDGVAIEAVSLADGDREMHVDLGHPGAAQRTPLVSIAGNYLYASTAVDNRHVVDIIDREEESHVQTIEPSHTDFGHLAGAPVIAEETLFTSGGRDGVVAAYR